jgi:hypothetical protein
VPKADIRAAAKVPLFDHLIGARVQRGRHVNVERLGGPKIEHHFERRRL